MSDKLQINSFYVSGYGVFRERKFNFGNSNFVLVFGQNEAGKSTLFSFLRGMISTFPSLKKKNEKRYLPLNGGEYGGEVRVEFKGEAFAVRKSGKDLSGIEVGDDGRELPALLSSIDRDHYKAIFAFDLSELTSLKLLDDTSLNERLFSSFIEGSEDVVSSAIKDVEKSKQELFRTRSKGKIDFLYDDFKVGEGRIIDLEQEMQERAKRASSLDGLEQCISEKRKYIALLSDKIEGLKDIKEASNIISSLKKQELLKHELAQLPILTLEEEMQYRDLVSERSLLNQEFKILITEIEKEQDANFARKIRLEKISIDQLEDYGRASIFHNKMKYLFMLLLIIVGASCLLFYFSIVNSSVVLLVSIVMISLGNLCYFYDRLRLRSTMDLLFDFALIFSQEPPYNVDILKKEFYILQNDFQQTKENLVKLGQKKIALKARLDEILGHPLAHLVESDVAELKSNAIKRNECQTRIKTFREALASLDLPQDTNLEGTSEELEAINFERIEISKELDQLLEQRGSIKADLLKLANSSELQALRLEVNSLKGEIERLLFSWRVDAVSEYLLSEALRKVGEEAFGEISNIASAIFTRLTQGAYSEVALSDKGNSVLIRDRNGKKLVSSELSQGTVEQLYLSLRLALVSISKDSIGQLPVLLDDVIVNFDKARAFEVLKVLKDLSESNQVFYFTCHEWIRDIYLEVMGDVGSVVDV